MADDEVEQKIRGLTGKISLSTNSIRNLEGAEKVISKTVRIDTETWNRLEMVKEALGTRSDSDAIRWLMNKGWEIYGEKVKEVAEKSRSNRLE